jgi:hypothetical protein
MTTADLLIRVLERGKGQAAMRMCAGANLRRAVVKLPQRDAYGSASQDAPRKRASVSAIVDPGHAVDDHVGDAGRIAS